MITKIYKIENFLKLKIKTPSELPALGLLQLIPGIQLDDSQDLSIDPDLSISFIENDSPFISIYPSHISIEGPWTPESKQDLLHLIYCVVKDYLVKKGIFLIPSIVIGSHLIIGGPGSGKTTLALTAIKAGAPIKTFDKSILSVCDGKFILHGGTSVVSSRCLLTDVHESISYLGKNADRFIYNARQEIEQKSISAVSFLKLVSTQDPLKHIEHSADSQIHQLMPFILDLPKSVCWLFNGCEVYKSTLSEEHLMNSFLSIKSALPSLESVHFLEGSEQDILKAIEKIGV